MAPTTRAGRDRRSSLRGRPRRSRNGDHRGHATLPPRPRTCSARRRPRTPAAAARAPGGTSAIDSVTSCVGTRTPGIASGACASAARGRPPRTAGPSAGWSRSASARWRTPRTPDTRRRCRPPWPRAPGGRRRISTRRARPPLRTTPATTSYRAPPLVGPVPLPTDTPTLRWPRSLFTKARGAPPHVILPYQSRRAT